MNGNAKKVFAFFLAVIMLMAFSPLAIAQEGDDADPELTDYLSVNGEVFEGTLAQAIAQAGVGGHVGVYGRIESLPIISEEFSETIIISDLTIQGETEDASVVLPALFFDLNNYGYDVFAIEGENVVIRDLLIDAMYKVNFPIRIAENASNISIENVVAKRGIKGGVGVFSSSNISFKNTQANENNHSGFYFDNIENGAGISFEGCSTAENMYGGVLIRNAYGAVFDLDLSGILCYEDFFCIEDRLEGLIDGGDRAEIRLAAAPKNSLAEVVGTDKALFFRIESEYQHIRYGITEDDILDARAYITTDRYGDETDIYYKSLREAEGDLREGESLNQLSILTMLINRIKKFIEIIRNLLYDF